MEIGRIAEPNSKNLEKGAYTKQYANRGRK